ncbi:gag-pol polyprotein [Lasius niger]|uniref:Gag-pol polyprotein n=1 Tax=Lasius niger TaxID=67767 RepID=A0A0J7KQG5_LASNI|nr:gag-pol polyprotein [Lasius niger]
MGNARDYLVVKSRGQEDWIRFLRSELSARGFSSRDREYVNFSDLSLTAERTSLRFSRTLDDFFQSCSILRGDSPTNSDFGRLSLPGSPTIMAARSPASSSGEKLIAEILRVEVSIERMSAEITDRSASLSELEAATNSALANVVALHPVDKVWQNKERVERTRKRGEASRSREGPTRTSGHQIDIIMTDRQQLEKSLSPQGSRIPSGRRVELTVPELPTSSSSVGPTSPLLAGRENEGTTAKDLFSEVQNEPLVIDIVECRSFRDEFADFQEKDPLLPVDDKAIPSTSTAVAGKRRAKASPDAISPSDEERRGVSPSLLGQMRPVIVSLRRLRSAKKRPPGDFADLVEDRALAEAVPLPGMSTDAELESEAEPIPSPKESPIRNQTPVRSEVLSTGQAKKRGTKKKRPPPKKKPLDSSTSIVSSDEDIDLDSDFISPDLEIMGASALGAMGLNHLKDANTLRGKHGHLNGNNSGKIKQKIIRAMSIINTLIYKAEAAGDPALLRMKNRELSAEVTYLKNQDVIMKRELEETRSMIGGLRKEISELKDKLDDAEEDRRKARESHRLIQRKLTELKKRYQDDAVVSEIHEREAPRVVGPAPGLHSAPTDDFPPLARISVPLVVEAPAGVPGPSGVPGNKGVNDEDEAARKSIDTQIKKLERKRAELNKKQEKAGSGKDSDRKLKSNTPRSGERPLPQRTPRVKPRIISSVQLTPPRTGPGNEGKYDGSSVDIESERKIQEITRNNKEAWTKVRKTRRRNSGKVRGGLVGTPASGKQATGPKDRPKDRKPKAATRRPPKTAAVMIVSREEGFSYAEALKKARESISLDQLEIDRTKIRRAANGGILIEVLGPGGAGKALVLKDKLHEILQDKAVVSRPVAKGEIRLVGLDCTTSADEVLDVVASLGGCLRSDIKVGVIRPLNNGLYTAWVQYPLGAVAKLTNLKKIKIGWTLARVEALDARPVQCFKCWRFGHLRSSCSFQEDFSGLCFRCGVSGHAARACSLAPSCKICLLEGRNYNHRLGSDLCMADRKTRGTGPSTMPEVINSDRGTEPMMTDGDPGPSGQRLP